MIGPERMGRKKELGGIHREINILADHTWDILRENI